MSFELIFTSAERGLKPGTRGFTTVAMTQGMPVHCVQLCESLSGYVHAFDLNTPNYERNPVNWSHYRMKCGGRQYSVLSRVAGHPKDYTGRTNKIAHHMMLEVPEETSLLLPGPAAMLAHPGLFQKQWAGDPRYLPARNRFQMKEETRSFKADMWERHGLKAEWAAIVARAVWQDPVIPVFLIFDPAQGHDPQTLIADALRLLPPARRWAVTFSSYLTSLPAGAECHIRGCLAGSEAAFRATRMPNVVVFDVSAAIRSGADTLPAGDQRLAVAATTGKLPLWKEKAETPVGAPAQSEPQAPYVRSAAASSPTPTRADRFGRPSRRIVAPPVDVGGRGMGTHAPGPNRLAIVGVIALLVMLVAFAVHQGRRKPADSHESQPEETQEVKPLASPEQAKPASQSPSPTESTPPPPVIKDSQRPSKEDSPKADAPHVTAEVDPPKKTDVIESKHEVHVSLASSDGMPIEAGDSFWMYLRDGTRADLKNVRNNLKTVLRPGDYGSSVGIIEKNRLKFQFNPERPVLAILKQGGRTLSYYVDTNCYSVITTKWTHVESHRFHLGGFAVFLTNIASKCEVHMMMGKDRQQVLPNPIRGTEVELESAVKKQRGRLVAQLKEELEGKLRPYRKIRDDIKEALPVYLELCRSRQLDDKDREKLDQTEDKLKDAVRRACEMEDIARAFANKDNKPCSKVFTGFDERLKKSPNQDDAQRKAKSCLMSIRGWKGDHNQQVHPHLRGFFNYDFDFQKEEWSRAVLASTEVGIAAIEAEHRSNQPDRMPCEIVFSLPDVGPIAVYHLPK